MKTDLQQTVVGIEQVAHPASGSFKASQGQRKRKARKIGSAPILSPECFNVRGGSAKKGASIRFTPAP